MNDRKRALTAELAAYNDARNRQNIEEAWSWLARAHILAQPDFVDHLVIHVRMLAFALTTGNWREVRGQAVRFLLAPLGNLTGRLPVGNTVLSNVSAFRPMAIPDDLAAILDRK